MTFMESLFAWMISEGIAKNGFNASAIANGLKLWDIAEEERKPRILLYHRWRSKTDPKNMLPAKQAFDLSVAGIDPDDVQVRQISFQDAADEYIEAESAHYESYFKDVMDGKVG